MSLKDIAKAAVAGVALGLASVYTGYQGADYRIREHAVQVEDAWEDGLESILDCSYPLVNITNYNYKVQNPQTGDIEEEAHERTGYGSMVGLFRDEQGRTYFLTSHHNVYAPQKKKEVQHLQVMPFMVVPVEREAEKISQDLGLLLWEDEDNMRYEELEVVATSENFIPDESDYFIHYPDIAILRTKDPSNYNVWNGDLADEVEAGDELLSVGYMGDDYGKHLIEGIVRSADETNFADVLIPTTLPINQGNSGGGVWKVNYDSGVPKLELFGLNRLYFRKNGMSGVTSPKHIKMFLDSLDEKR